MNCPRKECPGEMEFRHITHTFTRHGQLMVVEGIPAHVCSICGYTALDLEVLDQLFAFDPTKNKPMGTAPVYRLESIVAP